MPYCDCAGKKYFRNCRFCNPYICPCGKTISNNNYAVNIHSSSKHHMKFTEANPHVVIPPARETWGWTKPGLMN